MVIKQVAVEQMAHECPRTQCRGRVQFENRIVKHQLASGRASGVGSRRLGVRLVQEDQDLVADVELRIVVDDQVVHALDQLTSFFGSIDGFAAEADDQSILVVL